MSSPDLLEQNLVVLGAFAFGALAPSIEATRTDPVEPTQAPHRVRVLVVFDEGESFARSAEVNAIAFFKRSCSTFSCS